MGENTQIVKRVFLDINIVVDLLDSKRKNHSDTKLLIKSLYDNSCDIVISEDMLSTIYYIVKDKNAVLHFFEVVLESWSIVPFGEKVLKNAIQTSLQTELDLEDVLQCLCAKQNGCDALITHDKNFVDCGLTILNTQEFLTL